MMQLVYQTPFTPDLLQKCRAIVRILSNADSSVSALCLGTRSQPPVLLLSEVEKTLCSTANRLGFPVSGKFKDANGRAYSTVEEYEQHIELVLQKFYDENSQDESYRSLAERLMALFAQLWSKVGTIQLDISQLPPPPWDSQKTEEEEESEETEGENESSNGSGSSDKMEEDGSSSDGDEDDDSDEDESESEEEAYKDDENDEDYQEVRPKRRRSARVAAETIVHTSKAGESESGKSDEWKEYHSNLLKMISWVEKASNGSKTLDRWRLEVQRRLKGSRKGELDYCYISPTGRKLRSRREVANFLGVTILSEFSRDECSQEAFDNLCKLVHNSEDLEQDVPTNVELIEPFTTEWTTIHDLGVISSAEGFHTRDRVFPIGFKSTAQFVSRDNVRELTSFENSIIRKKGSEGPIFRVIDDKGNVHEGASCAEVWNKVFDSLIESYRVVCASLAVAVAASDHCSMGSAKPALESSSESQLEVIYREVKRMMTGIITRVQNRVLKDQTDTIPVPKPSMPIPVVSKSRKRSRKRNVNLRDLLRLGLVKPGKDVIDLSYRGECFKASISAKGRIVFEGVHYDTPSAFSIFAKRTVNPSKMADDGWKSCVYNGTTLDKLKRNVKVSNEDGDNANDRSSDDEANETTISSGGEWWEVNLNGLLNNKLGEYLFGLSHPKVLNALEGLPGAAACCPEYVYRVERGIKAKDMAKLLRFQLVLNNAIIRLRTKFIKHQDGVERRVEAANRRHMRLEDRFAKNWRTLEKRNSKMPKGTVVVRTTNALDALESVKERTRELDVLEEQLLELNAKHDEDSARLKVIEDQIKIAKTEEDNAIEMKALRRERGTLKIRISKTVASIADVDNKLHDAVDSLRFRTDRDSKRLDMKKSLRAMSDRLTQVGRSLGDYITRVFPPDLPDDLTLIESNSPIPFQKLTKPLQIDPAVVDVTLSAWLFISSFAPLLGLCNSEPLAIGIFDPTHEDKEKEKMLALANKEVEQNEQIRVKLENERKRIRKSRISLRLKNSTTRKRKKRGKQKKVEQVVQGNAEAETPAAATGGNDETESEEEDSDEGSDDQDNQSEDQEQEQEQEQEEASEESEEEETTNNKTTNKKLKTEKSVFVESQSTKPLLFLQELHNAIQNNNLKLLLPLHVALVKLIFSDYKTRDDLPRTIRDMGYRDIPVNSTTWIELVRLHCVMRLEKFGFVDMPDGTYVTNEAEDILNRPSLGWSNTVLASIDLTRLRSNIKANSKRKSRNIPKPLHEELELEGEHRKEINNNIMDLINSRIQKMQVQHKANGADTPPVSQQPVAEEKSNGKKKTTMSKQEIHLCRAITREIALDDMALAFCCPVDTDQFSDYLDVVPTPMDLQTIDVKLSSSRYNTAQQYVHDMRLVWQNCQAYNSTESEIFNISERLGLYFEELLQQWLVKPLGLSIKALAKPVSGNKRLRVREVVNPWTKDLPLAPWEQEENNDVLTVVEESSVMSDADDDEYQEENETEVVQRRQPRRGVRGDSEAVVVIDQLDKYIGSVVVKKFEGFEDFFEGVVEKKDGKLIARFHVNDHEETLTPKQLIEMEKEACNAIVDHEAEEEDDAPQTPLKSSPTKLSPMKSGGDPNTRSEPIISNVDNDIGGPERKNNLEEEMITRIMEALCSCDYEQLSTKVKIELLYFLCNEVADKGDLRSELDRQMSIVVQTRKTWRTNPPIIKKRVTMIDVDPEQETLDHKQENWTHLPGDRNVDELTGAGEVELYKIKNELKSYRNDTTVSLTMPLEKAMDRVEREIIDQYRRKDRKMQYKRWKTELEFLVFKFMPRTKYLGLDRYHNRYIIFPSDPHRIYIQPPRNPIFQQRQKALQNNTSPQATPTNKKSSEKNTIAKNTIQEKNTIGKNTIPYNTIIEGALSEWRVLDGREAISGLLKSLDTRGRREVRLLNKIRAAAPILTRGRNWESEMEQNKDDPEIVSQVFTALQKKRDPDLYFHEITHASGHVGSRVVQTHFNQCQNAIKSKASTSEANNSSTITCALISMKVMLLNLEYLCFNANFSEWMRTRSQWLAFVVCCMDWRDLRQAVAHFEECLSSKVKLQGWFKLIYGDPADAVRVKTEAALACRVLALDANVHYAPLVKRNGKRKEAVGGRSGRPRAKRKR